MIVSNNVKCTTCSQHYRIRYNVGNQYPQHATFFCEKCGEKLLIGVDIDKKRILENLVGTNETKGAIVRNLHPELTIEAEFANDPFYFPSPLFIMKHHAKGAGAGNDFRKNQHSLINYEKAWLDIKNDFRFLSEQRWDLLKPTYGNDHKRIIKKITKKANEAGRIFLEGSWESIYRQVLSELMQVTKKSGYPEFKAYILTLSDNLIFNKMYTTLSDYYKVKDEMKITLLTQKCGLPLEQHSSTVAWDNIEMVYGNLYETYGDLLFIPTALNNLYERDDYKLFKTAGFTWETYLKSDKAKRADNIMLNPNLFALSEFYDASIRNGTHHKTSMIDKSLQQITLLTGKGGRTEKQISFVDYIAHCNELYARILILFNILYKIAY